MKDTVLWISRDNDWTCVIWKIEPVFNTQTGNWSSNGKGNYKGCLQDICASYQRKLGLKLKRGECLQFTGKKVIK